MKQTIEINHTFILSSQEADKFLNQNNENFKKTMDRYRKHNKNILSSPINPREYNSHLVSDEFLDSCKKTGRLFKHSAKNSPNL
jgi:hypothetical protein